MLFAPKLLVYWDSFHSVLRLRSLSHSPLQQQRKMEGSTFPLCPGQKELPSAPNYLHFFFQAAQINSSNPDGPWSSNVTLNCHWLCVWYMDKGVRLGLVVGPYSIAWELALFDTLVWAPRKSSSRMWRKKRIEFCIRDMQKQCCFQSVYTFSHGHSYYAHMSRRFFIRMMFAATPPSS